MKSTMMLAVLLMPVALASDKNCTCPSSPPSPEDSPVCGSDGRTYSSECELQCADQPGESLPVAWSSSARPALHRVVLPPRLFTAHPGPCNTTVVASRRRRYTVEYPEWDKCLDERQCDWPPLGNCKECGADWNCSTLCGWNCRCGCMRLPTGGLDGDTHERWWKCSGERECRSKEEECEKNCDNEFCRNLCLMELVRCGCGCIQHVADTRTSTTAAPTSTTAAPTTSTTTAPTSTTTAPTSTTTAPTSTTTAPTSITTAPTSTTAAPTTSTTAATTLRSTPSTT